MLRGGLRVAGEGLSLEGLKRLGAALDSGMRLRSTRRPEVVAAVDLGQPGTETLQVGLGFLDFFVGRTIPVALATELAEERRDSIQDFAVLIVARGLKLGDELRLLVAVIKGDAEHPGRAAVGPYPIDQVTSSQDLGRI